MSKYYLCVDIPGQRGMSHGGYSSKVDKKVGGDNLIFALLRIEDPLKVGQLQLMVEFTICFLKETNTLYCMW